MHGMECILVLHVDVMVHKNGICRTGSRKDTELQELTPVEHLILIFECERKEGVVSQIQLNTLLISPALIVTEKNLLLVITSQLLPVQSVISGFVSPGKPRAFYNFPFVSCRAAGGARQGLTTKTL